MSEDFPPAFDLDKKRIMKLFTGERFYESVDAALREAILNSIDACGRMNVENPGYEPQIKVLFDKEAQTVTVHDNGDGMNEEDVTTLFSLIGRSAADLAQKAAEGDYKAVGEFGIGVVSYFLVADRFHVHTKKEGHEALGLEFTREMLDTETRAKEIAPERDEVGTTLILHVLEEDHYQQLVEQFSHWVRDVPYLAAKEIPDERELDQGGLRSHITPIEVPDSPDWVEDEEVGPPDEVTYWKTLDDEAHVDILYRGVYVQSLDVENLWGLEGSLHVDPKHFKPKLNREGFIDDGFEAEVASFLEQIHPLVLGSALESMKKAISDGQVDGWGLKKWVTIWLAVPRTGDYAEVAQAWDDEFWQVPAFRLMKKDDEEQEVSLKDIVGTESETIYLAPANLRNAKALVKKAVNLLRASGACVIRGIQRESSFLRKTSLVGSTTADLLNHFQDKLPLVERIEKIAQDVIEEYATVVDLYTTDPKIVLVDLGEDSAAGVRVGQEFWINVESKKGRKVVEETCNRNEGYSGLLFACQAHAPDSVQRLVPLLKTAGTGQSLGPVRRQYIRRTIS